MNCKNLLAGAIEEYKKKFNPEMFKVTATDLGFEKEAAVFQEFLNKQFAAEYEKAINQMLIYGSCMIDGDGKVVEHNTINYEPPISEVVKGEKKDE